MENLLSSAFTGGWGQKPQRHTLSVWSQEKGAMLTVEEDLTRSVPPAHSLENYTLRKIRHRQKKTGLEIERGHH